jgi:hypothetical protein
MTKTIALFLFLLSSAVAQTSTSGKVSIQGTTQMSAKQPAAFSALTLTTSHPFLPTSTLFPGFPTVTGGHLAYGYQGGLYTDGMALFTPQQWNVSIPQGTLMAYTGGSSGTFACTNATSCAANWDYFDMTGLSLACPSGATCPGSDAPTGYTCGQIVDGAGIVYYIPGFDQQTPAMMSFNPNGSHGSGGSAVSNASNYAGFLAPTKGTSNLGYLYGWCTGVFDGRYIYYAPTGGGTTLNTNFLRYDTLAAAWPGGFVIANFQSVKLSSSGFLNDTNAGGFLSSAFDGGRYIYLLPIHNAGTMVRYDTTASFTAGSSYKEFLLSNLGTSGNPQVIGNGNLHAMQTGVGGPGYVGGQMVWNPAGTIEYMYWAPFGGNTGASYSSTWLLSDVLRVPAATCSPGVPGTQTCSGTFTALDITASSSTWEIFDLANLATNQAWAAAGYASPAVFGAASSYSNNTLANQMVLGAYQLTWLNVHTPSDPIVGFVPDYGAFFIRHHVSKTLSDPSGWDVVPRPSSQANGCMGGGYDAVNQLFYLACPGSAGAVPVAIQLGPL